MGDLLLFLRDGDDRIPMDIDMTGTVLDLVIAAKKVVPRRFRIEYMGEALRYEDGCLADAGLSMQAVVDLVAPSAQEAEAADLELYDAMGGEGDREKAERAIVQGADGGVLLPCADTQTYSKLKTTALHRAV